MRVFRGSSTKGSRKYTTVQYNGHDVLAALLEYAVGHGFVPESELRGFKIQWNIALRYVEGQGLQQTIQLKTAREVDNDQPQEETRDEDDI
jgi:hypothetical protein